MGAPEHRQTGTKFSTTPYRGTYSNLLLSCVETSTPNAKNMPPRVNKNPKSEQHTVRWYGIFHNTRYIHILVTLHLQHSYPTKFFDMTVELDLGKHETLGITTIYQRMGSTD